MNQSPSEQAEARTAISVRDLAFSYGRQPTIIGFKWELPAGCVAALFGHSGAGKSTLLALLAGALPRSGGKVEIWSQDPDKSAGRQLLGYMPQVGGLYPGFTVEENLRTFAVGAGPHGSLGASMGRMLEPFILFPRRAKLVEEAVDRVLEQIQMTQRRKDPVGLLSAGLQQRVSLGVALLWDPEVLLLDEPLAMADDAWTKQAHKLFRDHAKRGRSVVYATANASQALEADHLALIRAGRLLRSGRTAELVPEGAAKVSLKYALKTGPLAEEVEVLDLAAELPQLMERKPGVRPIAVEIRQDARGARLAALLDN